MKFGVGSIRRIGRFYSTNNTVTDKVRSMMRKVPQPVVVVTTAEQNEPSHRRGITVSSFTSLCLHPEPMVSFCVRIPSRASDVLHSSGSMVVNMLSREQVSQSIAFSSPQAEQFKDIPYYDDSATGLPVLMGTLGSMHCNKVQVIKTGDHELWIARVIKVEEGVGGQRGTRQEAQPLLYYERGYRAVGEEIFMNAYENCTLDTRHWMHRAHLRMAWNYLRETGDTNKATSLIKHQLKIHFAKNEQLEYHETITSFYIYLIDLAIKTNRSKDKDDFFELMERYPILTDRQSIQHYYSPQLLKSELAKSTFVLPDLKPLPLELIDDNHNNKEH
ncbi:flavin reductase like domain-containing protein [Halteromyces radiatus]|uniref:flavin reductase like domain-containing protein n=1 Tax=Halteromyces radiatus TaxID=101107 RepID=UPI00221F8799|nr:flavin reductase like domain-containing protein [Halteromyces radiatus]KAI8099402.1 flavin reductase like domain-containing protein [Halteromyces radiatus]